MRARVTCQREPHFNAAADGRPARRIALWRARNEVEKMYHLNP
jgi:hypothetical protein